MFSEMEEQVLKIIGSDKHKTIIEITRKYYGDDRFDCPMNPSTVVSNAIRRINAKCEFHNLNWFLNGMGAGRAGRVVWKDKRKVKKR